MVDDTLGALMTEEDNTQGQEGSRSKEVEL